MINTTQSSIYKVSQKDCLEIFQTLTLFGVLTQLETTWNDWLVLIRVGVDFVFQNKNKTWIFSVKVYKDFHCHTWLHLGFSAKLRIWQVSAWNMKLSLLPTPIKVHFLGALPILIGICCFSHICSDTKFDSNLARLYIIRLLTRILTRLYITRMLTRLESKLGITQSCGISLVNNLFWPKSFFWPKQIFQPTIFFS